MGSIMKYGAFAFGVMVAVPVGVPVGAALFFGLVIGAGVLALVHGRSA